MEDEIKFGSLTFKFVRNGNASFYIQPTNDQNIINALPIRFRLKNDKEVDIQARITNIAKKVRVRSPAIRDGAEVIGTLSSVNDGQIVIERDNQILTFNAWGVYSEDIVGVKSEDSILSLAKPRNDKPLLECILTDKMQWDCEVHISADFSIVWGVIEARIPNDSDFVPIKFVGGTFEFIDDTAPYITSTIALADDANGKLAPGSNIRSFLFNDTKPQFDKIARHRLTGEGITDLELKYKPSLDIPASSLYYKDVKIGQQGAVKAKQEILFKIENYFDAEVITYTFKPAIQGDDGQYYFDVVNIRFDYSIHNLLVVLSLPLAEGQKITSVVRLMGKIESPDIQYYQTRNNTIEINYEPTKESRGVQNLRFYYTQKTD